MKIFITVSFIIFLNIVAFTQKFRIVGTVKDSIETNIKLTKAVININYNLNILTDENGKFELKVPSGKVTIAVRHIGYKPFRKTLNIDKDVELVIYLNEISRDLDQITVTAKSLDENIKRPIMGVSSISMKTLQRLPSALGEVDILRGLQMLPGVTSVGEASNGVNVRGGTTDQNLMLLDGAPIFNPTHMFGLFSAFPSDALSSFDLYKGNIPARFGGRTAAVLDVTMANPDLSKFSGQISAGIVSQRIKLNIPILKDKLGIIISGRIAPNDWLLPILSADLSAIKAKFGDGAAKVFYKINDKNTLSFSTYYSRDFLQTKLLGSINDINSTSTQFDYQTQNFSGKWFRTFGKKLNMQLVGVSSYYSPKTLLPELGSKNKVVIDQNINYKQGKINFNYQLKKQLFEFGADITKYTINPGELIPGTSKSVNAIKTTQEKAIETGFFLSDEINLTKNITLSAGVRYSSFYTVGPVAVRNYEDPAAKSDDSVTDSTVFASGQKIKTYGGFEPRFGLNIQLNSQSSVKLAINQMRQYLQIVSNTTTPIPTSRWKTSDTFIKPQIALLYSLGYFRNFYDNIYELTAEAYYRQTDNVVDYKPGANFLLKNNIETELLQGQNKSYGIELMLSKRKGELSGWINYTYSRSQNQVDEGLRYTQRINEGKWYNTNFDRPHTFNAALIINQGKIHDFSFNFTYSSGRPFTAPSAYIQSGPNTYPYYSLRNNSRIPNYHRLDFAWNIYNPINKDKKFKGHWTFSLYNLYGRKNAYSVYYRSEGRVTNPYKLVIFGAPIPSLSYNVKF
jgi:TonB dependent receptor/TonB-dependent Receptor Plug Domain/CarboxypepD_reg-like domain